MGPMDMGMAMANPLGTPMSRRGSGTSWVPDSTPIYGWMREVHGWSLMAHGEAFLSYQGMRGPRGSYKTVSENMVMLMATREHGPTEWRLSFMSSLEPATVGGSGYPLLFQTGETWEGQPLHDRQHPHNFLSEISLAVTERIAPGTAVFLYGGPVGEPALGPPAFPHRPIGVVDPLAPIGHHWQDATHITFGVLTGGLQFRTWQVEVSLFRGREPGEKRWGLESPKLDSYSTRLSWNPSSSLALEASYGFLKSPEALRPEESPHRITASAMYASSAGASGGIEATGVWGRNHLGGHDDDSFLLEALCLREQGVTPFARFEVVEKSAAELALPAAFDPEARYRLRQLSGGATLDLHIAAPVRLGLGAAAIWSIEPAPLRAAYGHHPGGWILFLQARPPRMRHGMGSGMPAMH